MIRRNGLSFVLAKTAHILRLGRSYMVEEGLQSLATRCNCIQLHRSFVLSNITLSCFAVPACLLMDL